MKKALVLLFLAHTIFAQNIVKTDTGSINGAKYKILFPEIILKSIMEELKICLTTSSALLVPEAFAVLK